LNFLETSLELLGDPVGRALARGHQLRLQLFRDVRDPLFVRAVRPLVASRLRLVDLGQLFFQSVGRPVSFDGRRILEKPVADVDGIRSDARFLEDGLGQTLGDELLDELLDLAADGLVTRSTLRVHGS